jgi:hypothetical protein
MITGDIPLAFFETPEDRIYNADKVASLVGLPNLDSNASITTGRSSMNVTARFAAQASQIPPLRPAKATIDEQGSSGNFELMSVRYKTFDFL